MKTDELLELLSQETQMRAVPSLRIAMLFGVGAAVLALILLPFVSHSGIRPNYIAALGHGFVAFKQLLPLGLALRLLPLAREIIYPEALQKSIWKRILPYGVAVILLFAFGYIAQASDTRIMAIRGKSLPYCLTLVPVFSIPIYVMILQWLKNGAPADGARAGLWAGLFSGATGCAIYAFTCVDDNPLFWTWAYSTGIAISGILGALVGRFALRW